MDEDFDASEPDDHGMQTIEQEYQAYIMAPICAKGTPTRNWPKDHLAYVEWYNVGKAGANHNMIKVGKHVENANSITPGAIVPLRAIRQTSAKPPRSRKAWKYPQGLPRLMLTNHIHNRPCMASASALHDKR